MKLPHRLDDDSAWRAALGAAAPAPAQTPALWPGIRARLPAQEDVPRCAPTSVPARAVRLQPGRRRARRRGLAQSLLASACLLLLVVLALPQATRPPGPPAVVEAETAHPLDRLLVREAEGLQREYAAAFAQFEGAPLPAAFAPGLQALDIEGRRLHAALLRSPHEPRLLDELRRVHERRLHLLRRGLELNA